MSISYVYDIANKFKINVKEVGAKFKAKINCAGEDIEHTGTAKGCTSYSDVLILTIVAVAGPIEIDSPILNDANPVVAF